MYNACKWYTYMCMCMYVFIVSTRQNFLPSPSSFASDIFAILLIMAERVFPLVLHTYIQKCAFKFSTTLWMRLLYVCEEVCPRKTRLIIKSENVR